MADYVFVCRNVNGEKFGSEPGKTLYLEVPEGERPKPAQKITRSEWLKRVLAEAGEGGNVLVFVHGFRNSPETVMARHRKLKTGLAAQGYCGAVVSFDWPSGELALGYLEDRLDAKRSALQLVSDGIALLSAAQRPDCQVNVHVLAHSMGAFVLREACDDADDRRLVNPSWRIGQILLIGADISQGSMNANSDASQSMYTHCGRLTNYSNRFDAALAVSNVKRVGVAPRAGKHGLPPGAPPHAVEVNCTEHWKKLGLDAGTHSWYFEDPAMMRDLAMTMEGVSRVSMETRVEKDGRFALV
jgi:esterase/lipase superfamily enzyme